MQEEQFQEMNDHLSWLMNSQPDCFGIACNLLRRGKPLRTWFEEGSYWQRTRTARLDKIRQAYAILRHYLRESAGDLAAVETEEQLERIHGCCQECIDRNIDAIKGRTQAFHCALQSVPPKQYTIEGDGSMKRLG